MKWFKHFTDAHDGNDLTKVRMQFGSDGYAVYWYCLELIAGDLGVNDNITFELKHDAQVIGFNLQIDTLRVEEIMSYMIELELFERSNHKITCLKLSKYLEKKNTRNKDVHKVIDASKELLSQAEREALSATSCDEVRRSPLELELELELDTKIKRSVLPKKLNSNSWNNYLTYRKQSKSKKLKPKSEELLIQWLVEQGDHHHQEKIVNQTIRNGWTGLFELKGDKNDSHKKTRGQRVNEEIDRLAREDIEQNGFTDNLDTSNI